MQININCKSIPTSFDVVCSNCEWTGVATLDYPENVTTLSVGGEIISLIMTRRQNAHNVALDIYMVKVALINAIVQLTIWTESEIIKSK